MHRRETCCANTSMHDREVTVAACPKLISRHLTAVLMKYISTSTCIPIFTSPLEEAHFVIWHGL